MLGGQFVKRATSVSLLLLSAALSANCATKTEVQGNSSPWVLVNPSPQVKVWLDTSRIVADSGGRDVWLRFNYATANPPMQDVALPWAQMEARERVDCAGRRAMDLDMILIDTSGVRHDEGPVKGNTWQSFETHPLTVNLFDPLCQVLGG